MPLAAPPAAAAAELEQRMLEKRAKVAAELLQTERDYLRDLDMCVQRVLVPLQQAQVGAGRCARRGRAGRVGVPPTQAVATCGGS